MGAIVSLGGCTASFVSPDGLIVTNHHCVTGGLQFNSTPQRNLLKDGYPGQDARRRTAERSRLPRLRDDLGHRGHRAPSPAASTPKATDRERYDLIDRRIKERVAACEKGGLALQRRVVLRGAEVLRDRADGDQGRAAGLRAGRGHRRVRRRDRQLALAAPHRRLEFPARLRRQGRQAGRLLQGQRPVQAEALAEGRRRRHQAGRSGLRRRATRAARSGTRPTRR